MDASSVDWEIDIFLSKKESKRIEESSLVGKIKRYSTHKNGIHSEIPITISSGKTSRENEHIDLITTPPHVYWEEATHYHLVLSELANHQIQNRGSTGQRIYGNPACKIIIQVKK